MRILAVDDDDMVRSLLRVSLGLDHEVVTAEDGPGALAAARSDPAPDAVVLDRVLPGVDGLAVLAELRADPATAGLPVVLLSARAAPADVEDGLAAGADAYVTKPFDPLELQEQLEQLVAARGA